MYQQLDYSCTIKTRPFLYIETVKVARLLLECRTADDIKTMALHDNLFQVNTETRKREIAITVLKRLEILDPYLLEKMVNGTTETSKQLVIYTLMKTDRLFYEFMREVYRDKLILKTLTVTKSDFSLFFQKKAEQSDKVASWGEYTYYKLQQVYTRILFEAGFVKKSKDKLEIIRPIIDLDVATHLKRIGDGQYVDILQGV